MSHGFKTRIDRSDPFDPGPCLVYWHVFPYECYEPPEISHHQIALWDYPSNGLGNRVIRVKWEAGDPYTWQETTPEMLGAARHLIANPLLIQHICPYCNYALPRHAQPYWPDPRGEHQAAWLPACAWNGVIYSPFYFYSVFTPLQWPPAPAW